MEIDSSVFSGGPGAEKGSETSVLCNTSAGSWDVGEEMVERELGAVVTSKTVVSVYLPGPFWDKSSEPGATCVGY